MHRWSRTGTAVALCAVVCAATACGSGATSVSVDSSGRIHAVATISAWGSVLSQLGGPRVHTLSVISNPNTDPHDYEPTPADARAFATANLVVENGVGYDGWAAKALAANPVSGRIVIDVGSLVGVPADGNPHLWYSPGAVASVAGAITSALRTIAPSQASYFGQRQREFTTAGLRDYHRLIQSIRGRYAGVPVGASESIVAPLADALGLDLRTPATFLRAISEGSDPSAADKALVDEQIRQHVIAVYVFNSQNSTPDVAAQVKDAEAARIPVTSVTETLTPVQATFEQWQVAQLRSLREALHEATGR